MLLVIVYSSIVLALESPDAMAQPRIARLVSVSDYVLMAIFAAEMLVKVVAFGLAGEPGTYLRDWWNWLDAGIVALTIADVVLRSTAPQVQALRVLRVFRVLRPLRLVNQVPELRVVVDALLSSLPFVGNVCLVGILIFFMFGLIGMSLFMGKMGFCDGLEVPGISREECISQGGEWGIVQTNFDNIGNAIVSLFIAFCGSNWSDVMFAGVDAAGVGVGAELNHNPAVIVYFICFMLTAFLFLSNVFTGGAMSRERRYAAPLSAASALPRGSLLRAQ